MSQQVKIDYEHIQIKCDCICEFAESLLQRFENLLDQIEGNSSSVLNEETNVLKQNILIEKQELINQINEVKRSAQEQAKKGVVSVDNHSVQYQHKDDLIISAKALQSRVNFLTSTRLVEFQDLLQILLSKEININYQMMLAKGNGVVKLNDNTIKLLESIEEDVLRQYTYLAYLKDDSLSGQELIDAGLKLMNTSYEENYEKERMKIRAELEKIKLDKAEIDKITTSSSNNVRSNLGAMREKATEEIIGEKIRQKSLKIIVNAIRNRGFVVNSNNIKLSREKNEVVLIAKKVSGETVEFKIYLDGKFIYDFHGYKGQACQDDIKPFLDDLENVYGMKIVKSQEIWSNPDKIQAMKYQSINTNKNKN